MKTKILFILIIIFTPLLVNISYSDCNGWNGSMTRTVTVGDSCVIEYVFCWRVNPQTGNHEIKLDEIRILPPCHCNPGPNPDTKQIDFNNPEVRREVNDAILTDIVLNSGLIGDDGTWLREPIPECDSALCLICYDAICFDNCEWDPQTNSWKLHKCDETDRKCYEATYFCWEWVNGQQQLRIIKEHPVNPNCSPCNHTCPY